MGVKTLHGLNQFLDDYPGMSTSPHSGTGVCLRGVFCFKANVVNHEEIEDSYQLKVTVPVIFPQALPIIYETDNKIPKDGNFHVNPDGSLCLGSPLRLLRKIHDVPTLDGFTSSCLIPYLYAVSYKLRNGGHFILGELAHGNEGIIDDYSHMLGLTDKAHVVQAIKLLGVKKRIANKKLCPCGCGKQLGACPLHHKLNEFRKMAPVSWFNSNALSY